MFSRESLLVRSPRCRRHHHEALRVLLDSDASLLHRASADDAQEGDAIVVVHPPVQQRVDARRAHREAAQNGVDELEVLALDDVRVELGNDDEHVEGSPGDREYSDDSDEHLSGLRLATLRRCLLGSLPQTSEYPAVERDYEDERKHELQEQSHDAVDSSVLGVRPRLDAVPLVQVQQRVVYDDVARVHGDGRCDRQRKDANDDDQHDGVGDGHPARSRVKHQDVSVDCDHRQAERTRVDDDGEQQREDAAQELPEDPVVRQLVVRRQRQVDDADGDVCERQIGDEHVGRRPHLTRLHDGHHHQSIADDAQDNNNEVQQYDHRGEHLVLEHVKLSLGRHQRRDVQLVEIAVEAVQRQRLAVVADVAETLEAGEQVERLQVPHLAVVAAAARRRGTDRRSVRVLHRCRPATEITS